jgi:hypothetical protein
VYATVTQFFPSITISGYGDADNTRVCEGMWPYVNTGTGSSASSVSVAAGTLVIYDISASGTVRAIESVNPGQVEDVIFSGTSALLATSTVTSELQTYTIENPYTASASQLLAGPSAGLSVARGKGQVMLGAQNSSMGTGKFRLWRATKGGITTTTGPWTYTTSGSTVDIAADATGCYAFAATTWAEQALQVVKIQSEVMSAVSAYSINPSSVGSASAVWHNPATDRVYLVTGKALTVLGPQSPTPSCP